MPDEKDRLKDALRKKEKTEEDSFFAEREKKALEKLRGELTQTEQEAIRKFALGRCPRCVKPLIQKQEHGVSIDRCPEGHGIWLDEGELQTLAARERDSWIGRLFYSPKR